MFDFDGLYETGEFTLETALRNAVDESKRRISNLDMALGAISVDGILDAVNLYGIMDQFVLSAMNDFALFANDSILEHLRRDKRFSDLYFNLLDGSLSDELKTIYENGIHQAIDNSKEAMEITIAEERLKGKSASDILAAVATEFFLTVRHKKALINYVHSLQQDVIDRERWGIPSDGTPDSTFTDDHIESQYEAYIERVLESRIATITELMSVGVANLVTRGTVEATIGIQGITYDMIRKHWIHRNDSRVRDAHLAVPMMNPRGVLLLDPFQTPLGPLQYPGDPAGLPGNIINCRCHLRYEIGGSNVL